MMEDNPKMAMTRKGLTQLIIGLLDQMLQTVARDGFGDAEGHGDTDLFIFKLAIKEGDYHAIYSFKIFKPSNFKYFTPRLFSY